MVKSQLGSEARVRARVPARVRGSVLNISNKTNQISVAIQKQKTSVHCFIIVFQILIQIDKFNVFKRLIHNLHFSLHN